MNETRKRLVLYFCSNTDTWVRGSYPVEDQHLAEGGVGLLVRVFLHDSVEVLEEGLVLDWLAVAGRVLLDLELVVVQALQEHLQARLVDLQQL